MSTVRSVSLAFTILRSLADGRPWTLTEVASRCSISPSSCLALLKTLVAEGVVERSASKNYLLAAGWAEPLAADPGRGAQLVAAARPLLSRLARDWEVTSGLWRTVSRDRLQLVALGESAAATRIHMVEGQRQPVGSGSVGRAFSAAEGAGEAELARRFAAVRWARPLTLDAYLDEVALAARRGFALDDRQSHAGVMSVAVVVPGGTPVFCLSATMFADMRGPAEIEALASALRAGADMLAASQENGS